ncbi:class II fumarate hydratase [Iamia sp. SCSIO 61187]|uniref:class II fumarate hydratase n=1 Tax=Iamia sp. SCSIO 61187 TaxID=2722752 RepID=UPI001C627380|nr:class II fumarate hydratase [Iamia sp. SCSIO 61187]QYG93991.1 class II fumarate hydratase [Iamia sp. SCSIO 61187]
MADQDAYRIEHDTMGEVRVPRAARWGAQTQRAVENFPVSGGTVAPGLIHALGAIKAAAAEVNAELGTVDAAVAGAIASAAAEVAAGDHDGEFPVDVFQTGSGTSTNMNANEVIAGLAAERLGAAVHPNDHVNASQSSNDVFPSAIHVAAAVATTHHLLPALDHLVEVLRDRAVANAEVVKAGRTHLMDATPVTLGQELAGYAAQVSAARERIAATLPRVGELPLGGTATGTGLNAPEGFAAAVIGRLAAELDVDLIEAPDHFAAQGARDQLVSLSGELRALAAGLLKVANDVRWMASGPKTGLAEIRIPDLQPGSSIMPGKVNPVIPEAVSQVVAQVYGNDAAVAFAGSQGNFELNVYLPVIARNLLESISLLATVSRLFADRCLAGIEADRDRCQAYAEATPQAATALNPVLGYERVAALVKESARSGKTIREVVLEAGVLDEAELDRSLDLLALTRGGIPDKA